MREAICDGGLKLASGRGAAKSNLGRVLNQNARLQYILDVVEWMRENKLKEIPVYERGPSDSRSKVADYVIEEGKLKHRDYWYDRVVKSYINIKSTYDIECLKNAVEKYKKATSRSVILRGRD